MTEVQTLPFSRPPRAICVLRMSAIGDVCHTLPVVRTLQSAWPQTAITWIVGKTEAGLVGDIAGIEFIVHDKKSGRQGLASLRHQLQGRHFDVLLMMQASLRATQIARLVQADIRLGFDRARAQDLQWLFSTHHIETRERQHVMDGLLGFADALGVHQRLIRWDIPLAASDIDFAATHIPEGSQAILISPCTSADARGTRNWLPEHFAAVARHAHERHGLLVLLTGGSTAREREAGAVIEKSSGVPVVNLIGESSLKELLALIARATALVCPDSGPGHMATAVGTPVISLFAGTNPDRAAPYLSREWVVNKYPEALRADCGKDVSEVKWGRRVRNPKAMELISVADVTTMLDRVLADIH